MVVLRLVIANKQFLLHVTESLKFEPIKNGLTIFHFKQCCISVVLSLCVAPLETDAAVLRVSVRQFPRVETNIGTRAFLVAVHQLFGIHSLLVLGQYET